MWNTILNEAYLNVSHVESLTRCYQEKGLVLLDVLFQESVLDYITCEYRRLFDRRKRVDFYSDKDESRRRLETINSRVILEESMGLWFLYGNRQLHNLIEQIVGAQIHDELDYQWCVFNVHREKGCEHGWHVDMGAYVLNLVLEENLSHEQAGGSFDVVPDWLALCQDYPGLCRQALYRLAKEEGMVHHIYLRRGQAVLMRANQILHRVSAMPHKHSRRVACLISWDNKTREAEDEGPASRALYM